MSEKKIWDFLLAAIENPYGAAGLMGNLQAESALNPRNLQKTFEKKLGMTDDSYTDAVDRGTYRRFESDGAGYGLAQWTYSSRKLKLLFFTRSRQASIGDLDAQLDFLMEELHTEYSGVLFRLRNAQSVREASDAVMTGFEKPADQSEAAKKHRAALGQSFFDKYASGPQNSPQGKGDDVMAINYTKYINSTGTHYISNSGSDERGKYKGGTAGDQTGKEWQLRSWYKRPWTCVLRWPDITVGTLIAQLGIQAALNNKIGYDQGQRDSYWKKLKAVGFIPSKITTPCEEDCTAGVNANIHAAAYLLGIEPMKKIPETGVRSGNMRKLYSAAGFRVLTESKYTNGTDYLLPGDILLYDNHHGATNITAGKKVAYSYTDVIGNLEEYDGKTTPVGTLKKGDKGETVKAMQQLLLRWKPDCLPEFGADGDFGSETEKAVKAFQKSAGVEETGVYDSATEKLLQGAVFGFVLITGGSLNVRSAPGTKSKDIGTVHKGDLLVYQQQTKQAEGKDWYLIIYNNQNGWVSSKYAQLVDK